MIDIHPPQHAMTKRDFSPTSSSSSSASSPHFPAQIDALERALQIALADDDAMPHDGFNIKRILANNPPN